MNTNILQSLKGLAEKLSVEELANWLHKYFQTWGSDDPSLRAPSDYPEPGSYLGQLLDSMSPKTWSGPTHTAFADAALVLFGRWSWEDHKHPMSYEDKIYIEDILYFLEKYRTSDPAHACQTLWHSLTNDSMDDESYARTLLAFCGQLYPHPHPETYLPQLSTLESEVKKDRAMIPAFICLLVIIRGYAISLLPYVYTRLKEQGVGTDNLLCNVAMHYRSDWDVLVAGVYAYFEKDDIQRVLGELQDCRQWLEKESAKN